MRIAGLDYLLAVGGPVHGTRIPAFPRGGPTRHVIAQGSARQETHLYRPQHIEHIQGVPLVLMHESITGERARIATYADAVTKDRDAILATAVEELGCTPDRLLRTAELDKAAAA